MYGIGKNKATGGRRLENRVKGFSEINAGSLTKPFGYKACFVARNGIIKIPFDI